MTVYCMGKTKVGPRLDVVALACAVLLSFGTAIVRGQNTPDSKVPRGAPGVDVDQAGPPESAASWAASTMTNPSLAECYSVFIGEVNSICDEAETENRSLFPVNVTRSRRVELNPKLRTGFAIIQGDSLNLRLFDDVSYVVLVNHVARNRDGAVGISGHVQGTRLGYFALSTVGGVSLGSINIPETKERFEIRSDPRSGQSYLVQVDFAVDTSLEDGPTHPAGGDCEPPVAQNEVAAADSTQITIGVVYTPQAEFDAGGLQPLAAKVDLAIAQANGVLANSVGGAWFTGAEFVRLWTRKLEGYGESDDIDKELDDLKDGKHQYCWVHTWRNPSSDTEGADLVVLILKNRPASIDFLGSSFTTEPGGCANKAFAAMWVDTLDTSWLTFAHELGHLLGCGHSADQAEDPQGGIFGDSWAYRWPDPWNPTGLGYCTVMAYPEGSYLRLPYFSNPEAYADGLQLEPTGVLNLANNAYTIERMKSIASAYRGWDMTGYCCYGIGTPVAGCVNGLAACECAALPPGTGFSPQGSCANPPTDDGCCACLVNSDCNDGDACTTDVCNNSCVCSNNPKASWDPVMECCNSATGAETTLGCADQCEEAACSLPGNHGTAVCTPRTGQACDDDNPCTYADTCGATAGSCAGQDANLVACVDSVDCAVAIGFGYPCVDGFCNCTLPSESIPTLSAWGMLVLTLILLTGAKMIFDRRPSEPA